MVAECGKLELGKIINMVYGVPLSILSYLEDGGLGGKLFS